MKLSIRSFLVSACLLAPRVVESTKTTSTLDDIAAVAIDRVRTAASPISRRSLNEYSMFGDVDDDMVLALLANLEMDPDVETCFGTTEALMTAYSDAEQIDLEAEAAALVDEVNIETDMDIANGKVSIRMEFSDKANSLMRGICYDAGGKYELLDELSCVVADSGFESVTEMVNVGQCYANITECKVGTTKAMFDMIYSVAGGSCTSGTSTMITGDALKSGAGLGFKIKTSYLVMTGMLVAAGTFL